MFSMGFYALISAICCVCHLCLLSERFFISSSLHRGCFFESVSWVTKGSFKTYQGVWKAQVTFSNGHCLSVFAISFNPLAGSSLVSLPLLPLQLTLAWYYVLFPAKFIHLTLCSLSLASLTKVLHPMMGSQGCPIITLFIHWEWTLDSVPSFLCLYQLLIHCGSWTTPLWLLSFLKSLFDGLYQKDLRKMY